MTERDAAHDRRQRRWLIALALLFFAPLFVSVYLYYGAGGWRPGHRVNHGDLIDPARPLPTVSFPRAAAGKNAGGGGPNADDGNPSPGGSSRTVTANHAIPAARSSLVTLNDKWTLLYWGAGNCSARCRTNLYNTRQVRTALNRDMDRVQRVFVADGECCDWQYLDAQHPDLLTVRATPATAALLALLPTYDGIDPATADRIYLIDPLGNLMMSYASDAKPKGLLEDLKRLLGLSSVG